MSRTSSKPALVPIEVIISKIIFVRGEKVLLDRDLAELYGVETKALKQAVRRNIKRFPDDFMLDTFVKSRIPLPWWEGIKGRGT